MKGRRTADKGRFAPAIPVGDFQQLEQPRIPEIKK
jgi:hypothetical protein